MSHCIVFLDKFALSNSHVEQMLKLGKVKLPEAAWPTDADVIRLVKPATILISKWIYVGEKIFCAAANLEYVVMAMTGYHDWVDIKAAQKYKVKVSNVPAFSSQAVAEHAILLMLSVSRKILPVYTSLIKGGFDPKAYRGIELKDKTIGIVGAGNIGGRIGEIANGFGMKVLFIDSKTSRKKFEEILSQSDYLSVNTPLTPKTEKLIGAKELSLLPKGAIVVNTSRGKVIDEQELIKHLKNGHLAGAGLDVFEKEPPEKDNPLFKLDNVVATPHIAWNTIESQYRLAQGVVQNIEAFVRGKPINTVA